MLVRQGYKKFMVPTWRSNRNEALRIGNRRFSTSNGAKRYKRRQIPHWVGGGGVYSTHDVFRHITSG